MHALRITAVLAKRIAFMAAFACFAIAAQAQQVQPQSQPAQFENLQSLQRIAENWMRDALQAAKPAADVPLNMQASVGMPDARLKLAQCSDIQTFVPAGTSLWGHTRVGMKCNDGAAHWNISLPVVVKAMGQAWVIKNHIQSGAILNEDDVILVDVDWAEDSSPVLKDRRLWVGQTAARLLTTGQTLRQNMVRPTQVFAAGAMVRVVAQGVGFQISAEGQAVSAGVVGQSARVRMDNGYVTSGMVLDGKTVKIDL